MTFPESIESNTFTSLLKPAAIRGMHGLIDPFVGGTGIVCWHVANLQNEIAEEIVIAAQTMTGTKKGTTAMTEIAFKEITLPIGHVTTTLGKAARIVIVHQGIAVLTGRMIA
uniref:Uncharacterized protein n=1 Tax=Lotharella globosa TaxID=91324 RepID=A0A7S4DG41_9EUKA|mmetsp:Transcript_27070/g.52479  ORF Transcript_27070/g.52479 Transcript_27070/m.52479 type:complete len:112 (-) Transcript_27070:1625-1960(-)